MREPLTTQYDYVVIGGGFYGCCLALYLRSISDKVLLVEASDALMKRASRVNQARVHTGFHYPRSAVTAVTATRAADEAVVAVGGMFVGLVSAPAAHRTSD